ncbi:MAG: polymorphic toxin-type HINT domain-containing protein, partial [Pirellulaceae bacterium]|nr:polymorphic toxin-type HINT domain-containing protein [Pirellulaceae bacterium]
PLLGRYRQTRADCVARMAPSAVHLTMARWCREHKLPDRERFHWLNVLEYSPNDAEALDALRLVWHEEQLIGRDEVAELQAARRATHKWTARLKELAPRLKRSGDAGQDTAAWDQFRSISDPAAVPALESVIAPRSEPLGLEVVTLLGKMRSHVAAASLIRLTDSPFEAVRAAALAELKRRPLHQSVPHVLAGMRWPVHLEQDLRVGPLGDVHYESTVTTEGPQAKAIVRTTASTVFSDTPFVSVSSSGAGRNVYKSVQVSGPTPYQRYVNRWRIANAYGQQAQASRESADAYNREAEKRNLAASRLFYELVGEDPGPDPQRCLDWWLHYNEFEKTGDKPVYTRDYDHPRYVQDGPVIRVTYSYMSCFARGTLIWTENALTPVEQVQPGDLVLSQDPDTGELAYKPVLQTTLRPPSPQRRICVEDEEIAATLGHPFWGSGDGWRMAKELKSGQRLHALDGSWPIRQVDELPDAEAYNLVVDDFHTYFVGRLGLLVHDNNFRRPTTAVLPGLHRARD